MRPTVVSPDREIGIPAVTALDEDPPWAGSRAAPWPFDPGRTAGPPSQAAGAAKTTYQQGDILDRAAVDALVAEADVVVHLACIRNDPMLGVPPSTGLWWANPQGATPATTWRSVRAREA